MGCVTLGCVVGGLGWFGFVFSGWFFTVFLAWFAAAAGFSWIGYRWAGDDRRSQAVAGLILSAAGLAVLIVLVVLAVLLTVAVVVAAAAVLYLMSRAKGRRQRPTKT